MLKFNFRLTTKTNISSLHLTFCIKKKLNPLLHFRNCRSDPANVISSLNFLILFIFRKIISFMYRGNDSRLLLFSFRENFQGLLLQEVIYFYCFTLELFFALKVGLFRIPIYFQLFLFSGFRIVIKLRPKVYEGQKEVVY